MIKIKTILFILLSITMFSCTRQVSTYKVEVRLINGEKQILTFDYYSGVYPEIGCVNYDCGYSTLKMNDTPVSQLNIISFKLISETKKDVYKL